MATKLTDAKIKGLRAPQSGQEEHADSDVPGLRVRIGVSGVKTFILRKRIAGKLRNVTLGRYDSHRFGLAAARRKARVMLSDIEAGKQIPKASAPIQSAPTIRSLMPAYLSSKAHLRSYPEIQRIADIHILPEIGDRVADAVTRGEVTAFIDGIEAKTMGRAVHAQLSAFYSWAMKRLDTLPANPCRDAGRPAKPRSRDRILTDEELAALWRVAGREAAPWGPGYKLLILTAKRREEVFQADWSEFDLDAGEWRLPPERVKNGVAEIVPLSSPAIEVLKALPRSGSKVFPTRNKARRDETGPSGFGRAITRMRAAVDLELEREGLARGAQWRVHDIRRTVATGLQRLGVRLEVTEAVLNHVAGSRAGVAGVYQRHDWKNEKRAALDAWGVLITSLK